MDVSSLPTFLPEELDFLLCVLGERETVSPRVAYCDNSMFMSPPNKVLTPTYEARRPRRTCTVPRCNNVSSRRGLCQSHGRRRRLCKVDGCAKRDQKRGFCATHGGSDPCSIDGCANVARVANRCAKHRHEFEVAVHSFFTY